MVESNNNPVTRRSVVGGAALGVTALVLPTAAHAVSSITAEWISAQPSTADVTLIKFTKVGYGQLAVSWVRATGETAFKFNVSIRASDVPAGKLAPNTQPVVYLGLDTGAPGTADWQSRKIVSMFPSAPGDLSSPTLYNSDPNLNLNVVGITFEATFTSVTGIVATAVRTVVW